MTKRLIYIVIILFIIYIIIPSKEVVRKNTSSNNKKEIRGVFISYIELGNYIKDKDIKTSYLNIDKIIKNIKDNKFNTIYLQVRSHMDSIYKSNLFPVSKNIILEDGSSYDVLDYFIKKSKKYNIDVVAWINPYRIGSSFSKNSNYYDRVKNDIKIVNNTYYLDPSSINSTNLIVDGVLEIVKNYKVKGIVFDDYFYPSKDIDIDNYNKSGKDMSIEEFHLNNINNMVYKVNQSIKKINKQILFGISPEGNIDNNYNNSFSDVKKWGSEEGYVDFLIPQIYYGFNNEIRPFDKVIEEWENIVTNKNIVLCASLAFYKTGTIDSFAKGGKNEWVENSDIIKRQILLLRDHDKYKGFSIFRYDSLFLDSDVEVVIKERENLIDIL